MEFTVSSSDLLSQLQSLNNVVNNNNTLPILDNFLFDIQDNKLIITASDLETTLIVSIDVKSSGVGKLAVPAKLITDMLKSFPDQPLDFSFNGENDGKNESLRIVSQQGDYSLAKESGDEFPSPPTLEDPQTLYIPSEILLEAINKTLFATGNDELRPVMNGVFFEFNEQKASFVATDAHKLAKYTKEIEESSESLDFILPKKTLTVLKNNLPNTNQRIRVEHNKTNTRFLFENKTLISRLIEGKYPNYQAVIPKESDKKLTVDRASFLSSIKRLSLFSNKTSHQIYLECASTNQLKLSAEDLDFSHKAHEVIPCDYEGEEIKIGFNSRFLIEMLSRLDSQDISIEMSTPSRATVLKPLDGLKDKENLCMLIMPIMIS